MNEGKGPVESLKELEAICQKPHWQEVGNWMVRKIERPLALHVTRLLLHTSITADQVTALSIAVGVLGGITFFSSNSVLFLLGVILFHVWYLLDHVDGQVARYRKSTSITGVYFDFLTHYIVHAFFFLGLGLQAYFRELHLAFLFLAIGGGLGSVLLGVFYDARYKAFFHSLTKMKQAEWVGYQDPLAQLSGEESKVKEMSLVQRALSWLYKSTEIHVALNIVTVIAVLGLWWESFLGLPWSYLLAVYYGLLIPAIFAARSYAHIRSRRIDSEFQQLFKV